MIYQFIKDLSMMISLTNLISFNFFFIKFKTDLNHFKLLNLLKNFNFIMIIILQVFLNSKTIKIHSNTFG